MTQAGRIIVTQSSALAGVALVTLGLYLWGVADVFAQRADRVAIGTWSVRCVSAGAIAGGQLVFAMVVLPAFFRAGGAGRASFARVYALTVGVVALLSLVAGGALAAAAGW